MAGERFSVASLELQLQARAAFVPVLRDRVRVWLEDAGTGHVRGTARHDRSVHQRGRASV
jgi:hypothetical protein